MVIAFFSARAISSRACAAISGGSPVMNRRIALASTQRELMGFSPFFKNRPCHFTGHFPADFVRSGVWPRGGKGTKKIRQALPLTGVNPDLSIGPDVKQEFVSRLKIKLATPGNGHGNLSLACQCAFEHGNISLPCYSSTKRQVLLVDDFQVRRQSMKKRGAVPGGILRFASNTWK